MSIAKDLLEQLFELLILQMQIQCILHYRLTED